MKYPSPEFDNALAALCHGNITDDSMIDLHKTLSIDPEARDEYLWQIELHARLITSTGSENVDSTYSKLAPGHAPARNRQSPRLGWFLATFAAGVCVAAVAFIISPRLHDSETNQDQSATDDRADTSNPSRVAPAMNSRYTSSAGVTRANVRFAWALDAPVIVGTGSRDPLPLGAYVPYSDYGQTLHVWDWTESGTSHVFKDIRLFESQRLAVSPDGKLLLTSQGRIIDTKSGEVTQIDLGPEFYSNHSDSLRRIQGLQFTPDGKRLALLVTNLQLSNPEHPLLQNEVNFEEEIQILKFPEATLLSSITPGHGTALRWAFSADGSRIATGNPSDVQQQQIVERNTDTGEIIRTYEPAIQAHAYALAFSPDGHLLSAYDGTGALLVWDTTTGTLQHKLESIREASHISALRFSPDSQHLAVNGIMNSYIIDVQSGEIASTIPQIYAQHFLWSPDGTRLTIVSGNSHYEGQVLYNHFPAVFEWDWLTPQLLKSKSAPVPEPIIR